MSCYMNPTTAVFLTFRSQGLTYPQIASMVGCHERTLLLLNKEDGYLKRARGKGAPASAARQTGAYSRMRKAGKSVSEIIAELGVSKCSVVK